MNVYVDSSSLLKWLLNGFELPRLKEWRAACSSELIVNDVYRTLFRLRLEGKLTDAQLVAKQQDALEFIDGIFLMQLNRAVIEKGREPFGTFIATLDALHLASAILWKSEVDAEVYILSHDDQLQNAARLNGLTLL